MAEDLIIKKKVKYAGVFDFNDFYEMLNGAFGQLSYDIDEVDHKKKGSVYGFIWEGFKIVDDYSRFKIWLKVHITNLKEVEVDDNGKKRKMYEGDVLMIFKGFIITDYGGKWEANPYLVFLKGFFDKYLYGKQGSPTIAKGVYKQWVVKLDQDVAEIINESKSFLHMYKA